MNSRQAAITDLTSRLRRKQNPQNVVSHFIESFAGDQSQMNVALTDLLFECCKIPASLPSELVETGDFDGIVTFVEDLMKSKVVASSSVSLIDYWSNALPFFEHFWAARWHTVSYNELRDSYLDKLVMSMCTADLTRARICSVQIKLKFFTSFFKNKPYHFELQLPLVKKHAISFLKCMVLDKCRQIWQCCVNELGVWFSLGTELLTDEFLRHIVWALKDQSINVVLAGLRVASNVLQNSPPHLLSVFTRQVGATFAVTLTSIGSALVFERVSDCCLQLMANFEAAVPPEVTRILNEHVYAIEDRKARAAGKFWAATMLTGSSVQNLRTIVEFLRGHKSVFVALFVDSLMNQCSLVTDWEILARVLVDEFEEKLAAEEKEILIVLVAFAVQQSVTENRPFGRMRAADRVPNTERNEGVAKEITDAFMPHLGRILATEYENYAVLFKIISYFRFDIMSSEKRRSLLTSCSLTFRIVSSLTIRKCALEVINQIKLGAEPPIRQECSKTINELISFYEKRFVAILQDLIANPNKYLEVGRQRSPSDDLVGLLVLNSSVTVGNATTFEAALALLQHDLPSPWNPVFVQAREICVSFCTKYAVQKIDKISSTNESLDDVMLLVYWLTAQLDVYYTGRLGEIVFFGLCELAKALSRLPKDEQYRKFVFPRVSMEKMAAFMTVVFCPPEVTGPPAAISDSRQRALIEQYLQMVTLQLFPLTYVYDVLRIYCNPTHENVCEKPLILFLRSVSEEHGSHAVAEWLLALLVRLFESAVTAADFENLLAHAERLGELMSAVKVELRDALCRVHKSGIDYAVSEAKRVRFLFVLVRWQRCLDKTNRSDVFAHLLEKPALNAAALKEYVNSFTTSKGDRRRLNAARWPEVSSCSPRSSINAADSPVAPTSPMSDLNAARWRGVSSCSSRSSMNAADSPVAPTSPMSDLNAERWPEVSSCSPRSSINAADSPVAPTSPMSDLNAARWRGVSSCSSRSSINAADSPVAPTSPISDLNAECRLTPALQRTTLEDREKGACNESSSHVTSSGTSASGKKRRTSQLD